MTAKGNPPSEPNNESYDLFFYPRLYPSGWDLSEQAVIKPSAPKSEPMPDSYEAFNEQRMLPSGWDLS
jgi:hypothetical protein